MRRDPRRGQALLIVVFAVGTFLIGAVGLAVDASQLYVHRQMAQTAADAAAQAGAMSLFAKTNIGANAFGSAAILPCGGSTVTPCRYAAINGFSQASDTVEVRFPGSVPGVVLSPDFTPAAVEVTVTRDVPTTFMRVLGPLSGRVRATATAAIMRSDSPLPIVVLHPFRPESFLISGTWQGGVTICGGPSRSVQVNSTAIDAVRRNGGMNVDLSKANGAGCTGNGGDFGVFGGPASSGLPAWLTPPGPDVEYLQPSPPIDDPFRGVPYPPRPVNPGTIEDSPSYAVTDWHGCGTDCYCDPAKPCKLYKPGHYTGGIEVKGATAIFAPGIYYIEDGAGGKSDGFSVASMPPGSRVVSCRDCGPDAETGDGMLAYISGSGTFDIGSNGVVDLTGTPITSPYMGILFFVNRGAPPNSGLGGDRAHTLGGGGTLTLRGSIYLTNSAAMTATNFQKLLFSGGAGSTTTIQGEIIVDALELSGGGTINMYLSRASEFSVNQVALVR